MYPLKSKQRFKKVSILVLVPYIILCITAGGFHAFDEYAYHGHNPDNYHSEKIDSNANKASNNKPVLCFNDHSEGNCIICKWLKSTPKKIQLALDVSYFIPETSGLCVNDHQAYYFLNNGKYHSRSPPIAIS
ncbi:MAG: hypothetical protein SCARUB_03316 [Candidatus Scalindua rubra]|uniref:Uncharacterized protein n=1 Tax=Candidatus Scalindua rubra TaxID=1872076 RepID=A0A1E3X7E3_9BACT|nr:MAG: hypothetical protein SCARUB_03316 [Candidatus Scalindua rubra]